MKRTRLKRKPIKRNSSKVSHDQMKNFFISIWNERPHYSEVSRVRLNGEPSTLYFHHILPKSKYKEVAYKRDNIILLTAEEHANVEIDIYRYDEVNKRRQNLLDKYYNI